MRPETVYRSVEVIHEMQEEAGLANMYMEDPEEKEESHNGSGNRITALFLMCVLFLSAVGGNAAQFIITTRPAPQEASKLEVPLNNVATAAVGL
jgi:hypothetical protein